jgi:preprotein translocase subunit YajC
MEVLIIPLLFVAMYMLVIRPQQRRLREQQALVSSLVVGDEVISSAGIYGTITGIDDQTAVLRVADGVEIRIARAAIARRLADDGSAELGGPLEVEGSEPPGNDDNGNLR